MLAYSRWFRVLIVLVALAAAWSTGFWMAEDGTDTSPADKAAGEAVSIEEQTFTCSMHPQIRQPEMGDCRICGMELIPVGLEEGIAAGDAEVRLSPSARTLAQVETVPVRRGEAERELALFGRIELDETQVGHITAWVPGRIDALFVNYTGIAVHKGEHMAEFYSPEILTAQGELILAVQAERRREDSVLKGLRESVRERMRLWGFSQEQIDAIEQQDKATDHVTLRSPMSGVVVEKNVVPGMYVETGTRLFTIADLSTVWLVLDAYEGDLHWLRYGQPVEFEVEARPGRVFEGKVSFIDPLLDPVKRTSTVRVVVDNAEGLLKPGMYGRGRVVARLGGGGKVVAPDFAGTYICPMHPRVVHEGPDNCALCGMPLEPAESLGFVSEETKPGQSLLIPHTAPLFTGERAVVYVEKEPGLYEARAVRLGARANEGFVVLEGLEPGERVVSQGAFKIDSAAQILGRASMMNGGALVRETTSEAAPDVVPPEDFVVSEVFQSELGAFWGAYFTLQDTLANDDVEGSRAALAAFVKTVEALSGDSLSGDAKVFWRQKREAMLSARPNGSDTPGLGDMRQRFKVFSDAAIAVGRSLGGPDSEGLMLFYCPMAFDDRGAEWLQNSEDLRNPYFGDMMLKCGEMRAVLHEAP